VTSLWLWLSERCIQIRGYKKGYTKGIFKGFIIKFIDTKNKNLSKVGTLGEIAISITSMAKWKTKMHNVISMAFFEEVRLRVGHEFPCMVFDAHIQPLHHHFHFTYISMDALLAPYGKY
jgi:hypothetical protein